MMDQYLNGFAAMLWGHSARAAILWVQSPGYSRQDAPAAKGAQIDAPQRRRWQGYGLAPHPEWGHFQPEVFRHLPDHGVIHASHAFASFRIAFQDGESQGFHTRRGRLPDRRVHPEFAWRQFLGAVDSRTLPPHHLDPGSSQDSRGLNPLESPEARANSSPRCYL